VISDEDRKQYADLARRIYAAWISQRMHLRRVDYALNRYASDDKPIGDLWIEIAKKVDEYAREETHKHIFGSSGDDE
jgi:hypothetical protein